MKVVVIRHGKVNFKWRNWSTSEQFDMDCKKYDEAPIIPFLIEIPKKTSGKIYISRLSRSRETAHMIFGEKDFISIELIDEVPLCASIVSNKKLPLWFWNVSGRLQWIFSYNRQQECRKDTLHRAEQFVKIIVNSNEDCIVVTHGFFMHSLINRMKKNGFHIGHTKLKYSNGEYIVAER